MELFEDLTVGENLLVAAEAAGGGADWAEGGGGLGGAAALLPAQLTNAQRRLVALTRAVAGRPTVLLLDEPAAGLDPAGRQALGPACAGWPTTGRPCSSSTTTSTSSSTCATRSPSSTGAG